MPQLVGFAEESGRGVAQVSFPDAKLHRYDVASNKFVTEPNPHIESLSDEAIKAKLKMCENGAGAGTEFWTSVRERLTAFEKTRPQAEAAPAKTANASPKAPSMG